MKWQRKTGTEGIYQRFFKRVMDFILALGALVFFTPIFLLEALLVRITLGSPILFKQKRPGLKEKIFELYKFRTMTNRCDKFGNLLSDKKRMTRFGKFLRSTSLDELPELWNILKGEMSFVGPRPQLVKDVVFMSDTQRLRHTVLPGLTGLAQTNGRNNNVWNFWEERLNFDIAYVGNISFLGDMKIIFQTILNLFKSDCINKEKLAIVEDFGDYLLRIGRIDEKRYKAGIEKSQYPAAAGYFFGKSPPFFKTPLPHYVRASPLDEGRKPFFIKISFPLGKLGGFPL